MATIKSTIELVDKMSSQLSTIESNINSMKSTLKSVTNEQSAIDGFNWSTFTANAEAAGKKIEKVGKTMTVALTTPLIMLGKKMYNASTEYEAAYTSMRKTVEGGRATEEQYQRISEAGKELSTQTPLGYTELMGLAQTAGNAGVAAEGMEDFLKVYSALQYATDQHISGDEGIKTVMSFLNITDGGSENIEQFANSLAFLGVNANSTEDEILQMANRFASAATIAGFSKDNIIGMAAAFESVGIRAEAGGSSAAKLIKQMQLAAEVGGSAADTIKDVHWTNEDGSTTYLKDMVRTGMDFVNYLSGAGKSEKVSIADQLGITVEALDSMADSWLLLDQFAEVSGKTSEQFIQDWSSDPAQAMQSFFSGLNALGNTDAITEKFAKDAGMSKEAFLENLSGMGEDIQNAYYDEINNALADSSILQTLNNMGLTEIRESNLIAAMATRPEMFAQMLAIASQGWEENSSMWEQFNQQMETTESQNAMLGNKLENTMSNFGDNLVQALQPVLETLSQLLDKFNQLSETDQTNIIKALGVIALLGPGLTVVGTAVSTIAKMMGLIAGHGSGAASAVQSVVNAANGAEAASAAGSAATTAGSAGSAGAGLGAGAAVAGGAAIAAVAYLFTKGIEYRNQHGALGSIEAIRQATSDNEALRDAFIEYVAANNELETAMMNPDLSDEEGNALAERQQQAIEQFQALEGWQDVLHLYNDWRDTNGLTRMEWLLPEDFLSSFYSDMSGSGSDVSQGLADGIEQNSTAIDAASALGIDVIDAANEALGVQSPSTKMITSGQNVAQGLEQGINNNTGMPVSAASAMAASTIAATSSHLNMFNGLAIGIMFDAGLAAGISAGRSTVIAAAVATAVAALAAAKGALGIASPSKETYWMGEMLIKGYSNAIHDRSDDLNHTINKTLDGAKDTWNDGVWSAIQEWSDLEQQALQDEFNNVTDGVSISDSDIKKIRTLAEREVINKFTTAEVKVEMTNNNNISSDMDVDSLIESLEDKLTERLEAVAEGVYS